MNDIITKLKKEIPNNSSLVIATSGGPDSMGLLNILSTIKEEKHLKLICAHVNHKLRKESEEEAKLVKSFCKQKQIIFEYMTVNEYKGNTEDYARKKRYEFFEKLIKIYNAKYLITAHHGDDLIETIIMRLIRGSSLKGYAGFNEITIKNNYKIYRPLITKTKEEILTYVKNNHIPYAIDKTNQSDVFTRNRIRKYILPLLKKENPNIHLKFLKFSKTLIDVEDYFENEIINILPQVYINEKIDIESFLNQNKVIQKKLIHHILSKTYKDKITLIKENHVNNILSTIKNKKPNQKLNLPNNKILIKSYNYAWIEDNKKIETYNFILEKKVKLPDGNVIEIVKETSDTSNYTTKINSKTVKLPLHVRNKKDGDKLTLKGLNKTKKLKDIFINEKIPITKRKTWPILTDNDDNIIWVPGLKKTKFDIEKDKNYDIIIRYHKKGSL